MSCGVRWIVLDVDDDDDDDEEKEEESTRIDIKDAKIDTVPCAMKAFGFWLNSPAAGSERFAFLAAERFDVPIISAANSSP